MARLQKVMTIEWNQVPGVRLEICRDHLEGTPPYGRKFYYNDELIGYRSLTAEELQKFEFDPFHFMPLTTEEIKNVLTGKIVQIREVLEKDIDSSRGAE